MPHFRLHRQRHLSTRNRALPQSTIETTPTRGKSRGHGRKLHTVSPSQLDTSPLTNDGPAEQDVSPIIGTPRADISPQAMSTPRSYVDDFLLSQGEPVDVRWDTSSPDAIIQARKLASKDNGRSTIKMLAAGIKPESTSKKPETPALLRLWFLKDNPVNDGDSTPKSQRRRCSRRIRALERERNQREISTMNLMNKIADLIKEEENNSDEVKPCESGELTCSAALGQLSNLDDVIDSDSETPLIPSAVIHPVHVQTTPERDVIENSQTESPDWDDDSFLDDDAIIQSTQMAESLFDPKMGKFRTPKVDKHDKNHNKCDNRNMTTASNTKTDLKSVCAQNLPYTHEVRNTLHSNVSGNSKYMPWKSQVGSVVKGNEKLSDKTGSGPGARYGAPSVGSNSSLNAKPLQSQSNPQKTVSVKPDLQNSVSVKPDLRKSVSVKPDLQNSVSAKSDLQNSVTVKPDLRKSVSVKPNLRNSVSVKPDLQKLSLTKTVTTKPGQTPSKITASKTECVNVNKPGTSNPVKPDDPVNDSDIPDDLLLHLAEPDSGWEEELNGRSQSSVGEDSALAPTLILDQSPARKSPHANHVEPSGGGGAGVEDLDEGDDSFCHPDFLAKVEQVELEATQSMAQSSRKETSVTPATNAPTTRPTNTQSTSTRCTNVQSTTLTRTTNAPTTWTRPANVQATSTRPTTVQSTTLTRTTNAPTTWTRPANAQATLTRPTNVQSTTLTPPTNVQGTSMMRPSNAQATSTRPINAQTTLTRPTNAQSPRPTNSQAARLQSSSIRPTRAQSTLTRPANTPTVRPTNAQTQASRQDAIYTPEEIQKKREAALNKRKLALTNNDNKKKKIQ